MSRSPCGTSRSSRSPSSPCSRFARSAPRRWIPTRATRSAPSPVAFFSTISWAMRTSVRRMSSPSRTTFSSVMTSAFRASRDPIKGTRETVAARPAAASSGPRGGIRPLPALELGIALLGVGNLDGVEVPRHDGALEDRARLVADLAAGVAGRHVREGEQPDAGLGGDPGRLARRAVAGLEGALALLVRERRLVDEHVGAVRGDAHHLGRRGAPGEDDPPAGPRRADDLLGADAVDGLAALEAPEVGTERDAERGRELVAQAPRPIVLEDRVAEGLRAVAHVERADLVAVVADRLARLELDDAERVAETAVDEPHRAHGPGRAGGAVEGDRRAAVAHVEGLHHAGKAEPVVGVQVCQVDGFDV